MIHRSRCTLVMCMSLFLAIIIIQTLEPGLSGVAHAFLIEERILSEDTHRNYGWSVDMDGKYVIIGQPGMSYRGGGVGYIGEIFIYKRQMFRDFANWSLEFSFATPSGIN